MRKKIPLARPSVKEEELEAVRKVLESGILAEGPVTRKFEKEFSKYLGVKNAVATTSCTTALHLALITLGIGSGDEVIVPDFTFPATGNVVFHVGASPILVDIDSKSHNVDPVKIERAITEKTKAIIPVHLFGLSAEMKPILEIAQKHGLYVIEDAACGIGGTYYGEKVGTFGDAACFSFHPRKILSTGEGGMLVTNNDEIAQKAYVLKDHGREIVSKKSYFFHAGYNYRLSDVAAAIGLVQLQKIDKLIEKRIWLARRFTEILREVREIETPFEPSYIKHTYQTYCLLIKKEKIRDRLIIELAKRGIETQIGTYALHLQPHYQKHIDLIRMDLRFSERAFRKTLALPLYYDMTKKEQDYVCDNLTDLLLRRVK